MLSKKGNFYRWQSEVNVGQWKVENGDWWVQRRGEQDGSVGGKEWWVSSGNIEWGTEERGQNGSVGGGEW